MTRTPLRVGIAGVGVLGTRRKERMLKRSDLHVVAVCDRTFDGEGTLPDGIRYYPNYQCLLTEDLDVLFVCLTNDVAAEVTIAGLEAGLHVFCEKPPGQSVDDIVRVRASERRHPQAKLMYGFNHRFHESVQEALRLHHSGELGRVINMRGVYGKARLATFNQTDWRTKRSIAGGGVLLDQGIHIVDLMCLFGGEFTEVHSFVSNNHWRYDVEDNAYALMRTGAGVVGMLHSSATQWRHRFHLDVNLERGSIVLGGILSGSKSYGAETLTVIKASPETDNGEPREETTHYTVDPSLEREIEIFTEAILNDEPIRYGSSDDALRTMQLVFKIYHADPLWRERYCIPDPNVTEGQ